MKAMMSWSEVLSVGDLELDEQHRTLFGMMNDLYDSVSTGTSNGLMSRLLDDLLAYTRLHFRNEERYFDQFRYGEREAHMQAHRVLEHKVMEYRVRFTDGDAGIAMELLGFMRDWIIGHIMQVDSRYRSFFTEIVRREQPIQP